MICDYPLRVTTKQGEQIAVPCGRCPPCKKSRVDGWVFRLQQEQRVSTTATFVTLTYNKDHVPITKNGFMTLDKKAFPSFMKRLRHLNQGKLKYFAVGEYGTNNKRPHYHAIVFNLDADKLSKVGERNGHPQYVCRIIEEAWTYGGVDIGSCSGDSIAYVAKYVNKPGRIPQHKRDDRLKEFSLMSKGLGSSYLTQQTIDYHKADVSRNYVTLPGGYRKRLPKYYRERIYDEIDMSEQRSIIVVKYDELYEKQKADFHRKYGEEADYYAYLDSKRRARLTSYWKNNQTRDL